MYHLIMVISALDFDDNETINLLVLLLMTFDNAKNITKLPNNLSITRSLSLRDSNVQKLPRNLKIGKNLFLQDKLCKIPDDLDIQGYIVVDDDNVTYMKNQNKIFAHKIITSTMFRRIMGI